MLSRLSFEQKLILVNTFLFLGVGAFAFLMITEERQLTAEPPIDVIESIIEGNVEQKDQEAEQEELGAKFGDAPIFDTLIALPTPSPTPEPTQPPDPPIEEALKSWKINGIVSGVVFIQDARTRNDFFMDIDDPNDVQIVRYRNTDMDIKLKSIDDIYFTATFSYTGPQGEQTHTIGMFDD